jgi:hypothetical protein
MVAFCIVMLYGIVVGYQLFERTYNIYIHFSPEGGGSMFLRNVGST